MATIFNETEEISIHRFAFLMDDLEEFQGAELLDVSFGPIGVVIDASRSNITNTEDLAVGSASFTWRDIFNLLEGKKEEEVL